MSDFIIRKAQEKDIQHIKNLQNENYMTNVNEEEKQKEGFLSLETDISLLHIINNEIGIMVAEVDSQVVGYEMFLTLEHIREIPFWSPFIKELMHTEYKGKKLHEYKIIIAGQVCIDKNHKGKGIIESLHKSFIEKFTGEYELIVSEVAQKNPRSLHVSTKKSGFHIIGSYQADGKVWYLIVQDISASQKNA